MATRHEGEPPLNRPVANTRSLKLPATLLGLGLGGFVDGILLHQVLQWHHMRTGDGILGHRSMKTIGGLEANTLADGLFHLATWALTVIGLFWLWRIVREGDGMRSWSELVGLVLTGWGISTSSKASSITTFSAFTTFATTSAHRSGGISAFSHSVL
jgi:uncharacterized membrane protein